MNTGIMHVNTLKLLPALLIACVALGGCQHGKKPLPTEKAAPEPELQIILGDLWGNNAGIRSLRVDGRALFTGPGLDGTPALEGRLFYKAPDGYFLDGRKLSSLMVWMAALGEESVLVAHHKKRYYHYTGGGAVLAPVDILREVLFAGDWVDAPESAFVLRAYDGAAGSAELEYTPPGGDGYRRLLTLQGRPWVVAESRLYDSTGTLVAKSMRQDYHVTGGFHFPSQISAEFPESGIGIQLVRLSPRLNEAIDDSFFNMARHMSVLKSELFEEGQLQQAELGEALP